MVVSKVSTQMSFGNLYCTSALTKKLADKTVKKSFNKVANVFSKNKFDKKRYVDVFLSHDDNGFEAIISSKKEGTPYNPAATCRVDLTKKGIKKLKNWLDEWNHSYSPKGIKEYKDLQQRAYDAISKDKEIKKEFQKLLV